MLLNAFQVEGAHTSVERCPHKRPNHIDAYEHFSSVAWFHGNVGKMYVNMRQQMHFNGTNGHFNRLHG